MFVDVDLSKVIKLMIVLVSRCVCCNTDEGVAVAMGTGSQHITERRNKWKEKKNNSNSNIESAIEFNHLDDNYHRPW